MLYFCRRGQSHTWCKLSFMFIGKKKLFHNTTLKQKREIRDTLRANNEGYSDDFFDSTPVRRRKPIKYPVSKIFCPYVHMI